MSGQRELRGSEGVKCEGLRYTNGALRMRFHYPSLKQSELRTFSALVKDRTKKTRVNYDPYLSCINNSLINLCPMFALLTSKTHFHKF